MRPVAALLRPADWLVASAAVTLVAWLFTSAWSADRAERAVVRAGGKVVQELSLADDRRVEVQGPLGVSVVSVSAGRVRISEDPGPRQICVQQGWLERAGEAALCLPNRVSVELVGARRRYDSLGY